MNVRKLSCKCIQCGTPFDLTGEVGDNKRTIKSFSKLKDVLFCPDCKEEGRIDYINKEKEYNDNSMFQLREEV